MLHYLLIVVEVAQTLRLGQAGIETIEVGVEVGVEVGSNTLIGNE